MLTTLHLAGNMLSGLIPSTIGNLTRLKDLDLSLNPLSGSIPSEIGNLKQLGYLSLVENQLTGSIPPRLNNLTHLKWFQIGYNKLIGPLPENLCFSGLLIKLTACYNSLTGPIPKSLRNCSSLYRVWLHGNQLSGNISEDFGIYPSLDYIDLSHNNFYGELSKNWGKCHNLTSLKMSNNKISGFTSEIRALTEIRHHNIVKLYGYCSHPRHSFLVYEFLEGGSLGKVLSKDDDTIVFDWIKRVNTVKGVANALSYMHHDCFQPIIHRDISSKNVLFDLEYVAHISDFGTARFMNLNSSNWTSFAGTFGYAAPGSTNGPNSNLTRSLEG
ncbi:hypothetical protein ACSBR1_030407 [Camellia fascicularis]